MGACSMKFCGTAVNENGSPISGASIKLFKYPAFHLDPSGFYPSRIEIDKGKTGGNGQFCIHATLSRSGQVHVSKGGLVGNLEFSEIKGGEFVVVLRE